MDIGWNFRREDLRLQQRSHDVIPEGGDQPNVVPSNTKVWYFFRENDYEHIKDLWELGNTMARGAAMMTSTDVTWKILGTAWPKHMNKVLSEAMEENIKVVGMPTWSDADQTLARGIQRELKMKEEGLEKEVGAL